MKITEQALQRTIVEMAQLGGWMVMHTRPAMNRDGEWSTPIQGDPGFPDLILANDDGEVIAAELKSETGKVADDQRRWLMALKSGGVETYVWRPRDLDDITERLTGMRPV